MKSKNKPLATYFADQSEEIAVLKQKIALARNKLQKLWDERGTTDSVVLAAGDELDILLNRYQELIRNQKSEN